MLRAVPSEHSRGFAAPRAGRCCPGTRVHGQGLHLVPLARPGVGMSGERGVTLSSTVGSRRSSPFARRPCPRSRGAGPALRHQLPGLSLAYPVQILRRGHLYNYGVQNATNRVSHGRIRFLFVVFSNATDSSVVRPGCEVFTSMPHPWTPQEQGSSDLSPGSVARALPADGLRVGRLWAGGLESPGPLRLGRPGAGGGWKPTVGVLVIGG